MRLMHRWGLKYRVVQVGVLLSLAWFLSACSPVKMGGELAVKMTEEKTLPFMLQDDDVDMACASGETLTPVLRSIAVTGADPDQLAAMTYVTAAYCSEQRAFAAELRYLRAQHDNLIDDAEDARIVQKRESAIAARRQWAAYRDIEHYFKSHFHVAIGGRCPSFHRTYDELSFMVGMIAGVQAMGDDIQSQNQVGVPQDIAAKVERSMGCLDNSRWWGVPLAIRAAVWNMLPGATPPGADPWQSLVQAAKIGRARGVRLSYVVYALSAQTKGDDAHLRDALRMYAADSKNFSVDPKYRIFDAIAQAQIQNISDRYWTEHTGSRTPIGALGTFWDDKKNAAPSLNLNLDNM